MADISAPNPLSESQREKAGADTFSKYDYQYHWALYRLLIAHETSKEYAVFVELHEDVVLSNSLDSSSANFEFNQVKTTARTFTINELTKLKNKQSVLGKLLGSCINRGYSSYITEIKLIAISGFDFQLKNPDLDLDVIRPTDISDGDISAIEKKLKAELVCDTLPSNLHFVVPDLPSTGFQHYIRGQISDLISSLFPHSFYNSVNVYRALYDEITRKGAIKYDYVLWDDLLRKKAITSTNVTRLIEQNISNKSESDIEELFGEIAMELKLRVLSKEKLRKEFNRYRQRKIGNRTSLQLETSVSMKKLIDESMDSCNDEIEMLFQIVKEKLSDKIKSQFTDDTQLLAAIICEYIMKSENV